MGFIISPFLSPFAFGFLAARARRVKFSSLCVLRDLRNIYSWRWAYGIAIIYSVIVLFLIIFFMEET